jgi:hypothetical protein
MVIFRLYHVKALACYPNIIIGKTKMTYLTHLLCTFTADLLSPSGTFNANYSQNLSVLGIA